jgi:hypothetical protein
VEHLENVLSFIVKRCHALERLYLSGRDKEIPTAVFGKLSASSSLRQSLRFIEINNIRITDFAEIKHFIHLEELWICGVDFTKDEELHCLAALTRLRGLSLSSFGNNISGSFLDHVCPSLTNLKSLSISHDSNNDNPLRVSGIKHVSKSLESLCLYNVNYGGFDEWREFPCLGALTLVSVDCSKVGVSKAQHRCFQF